MKNFDLITLKCFFFVNINFQFSYFRYFAVDGSSVNQLPLKSGPYGTEAEFKLVSAQNGFVFGM